MVSGDDSNGGRLSRKTTRSPNRKSKKTDADVAKGSSLRNGSQPSVHKRNLYVVSFPIIILFNLLRSVLYQLFIIFKYLYSASHRLMQKPRNNGECSLEVVVKDGVVSTELATNEEMSHVHTVRPGDPLLAKQKHHHRKAFEYISKALKIDEENEGQKELAIELYKKGIYELERGIAVDCWGGRGDAWQRAQRLHDKMKTNLGMAKDRLHFLGNELACDCHLAWMHKLRHEARSLKVRTSLENFICKFDAKQPSSFPYFEKSEIGSNSLFDSDDRTHGKDYSEDEFVNEEPDEYEEPRRSREENERTLLQIPVETLPCPQDAKSVTDRTYTYPSQNEAKDYRNLISSSATMNVFLNLLLPLVVFLSRTAQM